MYICNVCMCIYNVRICVYTSVHISLYVQCLYNSACLTFHTSDTNKEKANSYEYTIVVRWTVGGFVFCGSQLDLWLTARTLSNCKKTLSTTRQHREGLSKMNTICYGRWCSSLQSERAHSKLVWNIVTARDTSFISTYLKPSLK